MMRALDAKVTRHPAACVAMTTGKGAGPWGRGAVQGRGSRRWLVVWLATTQCGVNPLLGRVCARASFSRP